MTNEEQDRTKIETLNALKGHLACLQAKAEHFQEQFAEASRRLDPILPQTEDALSRMMRPAPITETPLNPVWPTPAELDELMADHDHTQARIKTLTERCRQWNFPV